MKYLNLKIMDRTYPISSKNFILALQYIGEQNPLKITKINLKKNFKADKQLKNYFNLGVLNVRKKLNGHLGLSGKFSNNMIKHAATVEGRDTEDGAILKAKIPHKYYIRIVNCVYEFLRNIDNNFGTDICIALSNREIADNYLGKSSFSDKKLKMVAPIQTAIIMLSEGHKLSVSDLNALKNKIK